MSAGSPRPNVGPAPRARAGHAPQVPEGARQMCDDDDYMTDDEILAWQVSALRIAKLAVCQSCCRLLPISAFIPDPNEDIGLCPHCPDPEIHGSVGCADGASLADALALARGDWANAGLQDWVVPFCVSWTPDGGLVTDGSPEEHAAREAARARFAASQAAGALRRRAPR